MKMTITGRTLTLVISGVLACAATACGDDGGGSSTDPTGDGGTSTATSTDDETNTSTSDDEATDDETETSGDDDPTDTNDDDPTADDDTVEDDDPPPDDAEDGGGGGDDPPTDDDVGEEDGGTTEEPPPEDDSGTPPPPPPSGDIDDLVAAICNWEYRCCDAGELAYRMGPDRETVESCTEYFTYQLNSSNSQENVFYGGSALGLLGTLAFNVDLDRAEPNPDGIEACIEAYNEMACAEEYEPQLHCGGPTDYSVPAVCDLANLFTPVVEEGEECTVALAENGLRNDVECLPGSTCLPAGDPENPNNDPACVSRGLDGDPCTDDDDCDFGFYCGEGGDCAEKGGEGDPCSFEDPEAPQPGAVDAACKLGLNCHPLDLVCVSNCSEGYTCTLDSECPEGLSCAPLSVGDDSTSFHVCRELGASASARCDNEADCVEGRYCDGSGVCASDSDENAACTVDAQCPEGTYCNGTCAAFTLRGAACARSDVDFSSPQCEPAAVGCIFDETDQQLECKSAKNAEGVECLVDYDCASNLCELATPDDLVLTCVSGASDGDECDADVATGEALRCGVGFVCVEGECTTQDGPGGSCDTDGAADASLCASGSCQLAWEDDYICTDLAVPESAGGSGLTCDGN